MSWRPKPSGAGGTIRPWFHRSWIFPRDPKAGRILYEVISADEKTSVHTEHEYKRAGAWAYLNPPPGSPPSTGWSSTRDEEHRGASTMIFSLSVTYP